jgi:hypothetical protein
MSPLNPQVEALLAQLETDPGLEFVRLLEAVHTIRFTGPLTVDFLNGIPRQINLGHPVKLAICQGVDKSPRTRAG